MTVNIQPLDMSMALAVMEVQIAPQPIIPFLLAAEARYRYMLADAMLAERDQV